MKSLTFTWATPPASVDGIHVYFSKFSNPLGYEGSKPGNQTSHVFHNLNPSDRVNVGVQFFTIDDVTHQRVMGDVKTAQVNMADGVVTLFGDEPDSMSFTVAEE